MDFLARNFAIAVIALLLLFIIFFIIIIPSDNIQIGGERYIDGRPVDTVKLKKMSLTEIKDYAKLNDLDTVKFNVPFTNNINIDTSNIRLELIKQDSILNASELNSILYWNTVSRIIHLENQFSKRVSDYNYELMAKEKNILFNNLKHNFRIKRDNVYEREWIFDLSSPHYVDVNSLHVYFEKKMNSNEVFNLRLRIQYEANTWLFIRSYVFNADGEIYTIDCEYDDIVRKATTDGIYEYLDKSPNLYDMELLKAVAFSKKTILRYVGDDNGAVDRIITNAEKKAIKNIITSYVTLGGTM